MNRIRTTPTRLIPKKVTLLGHDDMVVTIALLTPTEMHRKYGEYYDGMLDAPARHIDINRNLKLQRKWWVFAQIWIQFLSEYWVPWLIELGVADERAKYAGMSPQARAMLRLRNRWPRPQQRREARLAAGLTPGGRPRPEAPQPQESAP